MLILSFFVIIFILFGINGFSKSRPQLESVFAILNGQNPSVSMNISPFASLLPEKKFNIPIITYHYVEIVQNKDDFIRERLSIKPDTFEAQLKTLKRLNYQTVWVKEIPKIVTSNKNLENKPIALTFDDAYGDFYTDVFPLIKKYNTKVTLYVISDFINRPNYMTSSQLTEVIKSGLVEIGAHSVNHLDLPSVSEEVANYQIVTSKESLENTYKIKIETFCYPYGFYNDKVAKMVQDAGYTAAVSEVANTTQSKSNLFYLSRIRVGGFDSVIN